MTVFWCCFLCGQAVGIVCDIMRSFRRCVKNGRVSVAVQDIFLCAFAFAIFSYSINTCNDGALRWYEFASFGGSIVLYYSAESSHIMKIFVRIISSIVKPVKTVFSRLTALYNSLKCFFGLHFKKIYMLLKTFFGCVRQFCMKKTSKTG